MVTGSHTPEILQQPSWVALGEPGRLGVVWSRLRGRRSETTEETMVCFPLHHSADNLPSQTDNIVLSLTNRLKKKIGLAQVWESGMYRVLSEIFQLLPEAEARFQH